jgi:hypothetical protein
MSRVNQKLRDFAERLIAYETKGNRSSETKTPAACLAGEKLRPHLATLMGNIGFSALLSRALALGIADVPWLRAVHVKTDGSFDGLEELGAQIDPDEFFEGCVLLLSHLLGLLVAFIGEEITLRLVREVWPELSPSDLVFGKGD